MGGEGGRGCECTWCDVEVANKLGALGDGCEERWRGGL